MRFGLIRKGQRQLAESNTFFSLRKKYSLERIYGKFYAILKQFQINFHTCKATMKELVRISVSKMLLSVRNQYGVFFFNKQNLKLQMKLTFIHQKKQSYIIQTLPVLPILRHRKRSDKNLISLPNSIPLFSFSFQIFIQFFRFFQLFEFFFHISPFQLALNKFMDCKKLFYLFYYYFIILFYYFVNFLKIFSKRRQL